MIMTLFLFPDTLRLTFVDGSTATTVGLDKSNIAWASDKSVKFKNPASKF